MVQDGGLIKKTTIKFLSVYVKLLTLLRPISIGQASSIWNGYTDITIDTRLTVFNTKNMQEFQIQYKRAQYYNIMSYAWEVLSRNKDERDILIANEKIRLYGQSLLANSTYKMFFKMDGQDLRDVVKTFGLTR